MNENSAYKTAILSILTEAKEPLDVEKLRTQAGIGNWQTALKHLLELKISGLIEGQKTSKSWVFWAKSNHEVTLQNE